MVMTHRVYPPYKRVDPIPDSLYLTHRTQPSGNLLPTPLPAVAIPCSLFAAVDSVYADIAAGMQVV